MFYHRENDIYQRERREKLVSFDYRTDVVPLPL